MRELASFQLIWTETRRAVGRPHPFHAVAVQGPAPQVAGGFPTDDYPEVVVRLRPQVLRRIGHVHALGVAEGVPGAGAVGVQGLDPHHVLHAGWSSPLISSLLGFVQVHEIVSVSKLGSPSSSEAHCSRMRRGCTVVST